ncbi:MAG: NAD(P)-binding protein [Myxococcota bacterium]
MGGLIEADYVVIGAGAMGLAFTDEILTRTDASVAILDRRARPGGHWNDAYPFVRLHQPSHFYGVNSQKLGTDAIDRTGWNAGLAELASGTEVCAYYDQLMNRRFLPSGRVAFHPSTSWDGERAVSTPSGRVFEVHARRAIVDAAYMKVSVPSTHPPRYAVEDGVRVVPPNALPKEDRPADGYTIIGAGKTAFDAILWLLANHVDPAEITWIVPRDSWLINRAVAQPGDGFRVGEQVGLLAEAASAHDALLRLEAAGQLLRIDPRVEPSMYRCATVSEPELEQLRRIEQVVRMGRVARVTQSGLELDGGVLEQGPNVLYVDCTADGLERRPVVPVFAERRITLQTVRGCQQVFSAALLGMIETLAAPVDEKNALAGVIPHPDATRDYFSNTLEHMKNMVQWSQHPEIGPWLAASRLSPGGGPDSEGPDPAKALRAAANLQQFLEDWKD